MSACIPKSLKISEKFLKKFVNILSNSTILKEKLVTFIKIFLKPLDIPFNSRIWWKVFKIFLKNCWRPLQLRNLLKRFVTFFKDTLKNFQQSPNLFGFGTPLVRSKICEFICQICTNLNKQIICFECIFALVYFKKHDWYRFFHCYILYRIS